jgi:ketosteroid isomerase-like protein
MPEGEPVMRLLLMLAGSLALAACARPGTPITEAEANRIADSIEATFNSGDTARIMAGYAPGAVMFDAGTPEPTRDRALQTKWADGFVALKPRNFSPGKRELQLLDSDTFDTAGIESFEGDIGRGHELIRFRYTDVYQKQADGKWRIVHEHLSALPPSIQPTG